MISRTTDEIIVECEKIIEVYASLCNRLFSKPGTKGIERKAEFLRLVRSLKPKTPEEAFLALHNFHIKENGNGRLMDLLHEVLIRTANIKVTTHPGYNWQSRYNRLNELQINYAEKVQEIEQSLGIEKNTNVCAPASQLLTK